MVFISSCNLLWAHYVWIVRICSPILLHQESKIMVKLLFVSFSFVLLAKGIFFKLGFCKNNKRILLKGLNLYFGSNHIEITKYLFEEGKARNDCGYKYRKVIIVEHLNELCTRFRCKPSLVWPRVTRLFCDCTEYLPPFP